MIEVISLHYGPVFKRVFSQLEVFQRFTSAVLGIPIKVDQVHTEYEYPKPVGFVRNRYDLFAEDIKQRIIVEIQQVKEEDFFDRFLYYHLISLVEQVKGFQAYCFDRTVYTIVVLTSIPEDQSVNFSYAQGDFNLVDECGKVVPVYPHRMIFLAPRLVNANTPPEIKDWLEFIKDSLDGKMDDSRYGEVLFQDMMEQMRRSTISPDELSAIKDEAAWELAKARFAAEGEAKGRAEGKAEGKAEGVALILTRQLMRRFGKLPKWAQARLDKADTVQLEAWAEAIFDAKSLKELLG